MKCKKREIISGYGRNEIIAAASKKSDCQEEACNHRMKRDFQLDKEKSKTPKEVEHEKKSQLKNLAIHASQRVNPLD